MLTVIRDYISLEMLLDKIPTEYRNPKLFSFSRFFTDGRGPVGIT